MLLLNGKISPAMLISRRGVVSVDDGFREFQSLEPLSVERQTALRRRAEALFSTHPDVHLVVVGRTDPAAHYLEIDEREQGTMGELRSPVLYFWAGPDSVHRVLSAPEVEAGSLCPFCGCAWEGGPCEHVAFTSSDSSEGIEPAFDVRELLKELARLVLRRLTEHKQATAGPVTAAIGVVPTSAASSRANS